MAAIKLNTEDLRAISSFERITKVHPKDCIDTEDSIYFLLEPNKIGLAIGKGGSTIKEAVKTIGKSVKLFEYSEDPTTFFKNMVPTAENIEINGTEIKATVPNKDRSVVIGKGGKNINVIKEFLSRYCGITSVKLK